MTEDPSEA